MDTRGAILDSDSADVDQSESTNIDSQTGSILDPDSADFVPLCQDKSTSTTDLPTAGDDATFDVELSNVQVDAVHPLFTEVFGTRRKRSVGTSTTEDRCQLYFCADCDTFIYKTWLDVTNHFLTIKHVPKHDCVYCGGAVFEYFDNRTLLLHHKCDNISPSNCDQLDRSSKPGYDDKVNGKIKG